MSVLNPTLTMFDMADDTPKITIKEFLKMIKSVSDKKFELIDGQVIAMANTKPQHGMIMNNCSWLLQSHLRKNQSPCHFFSDIICKIDEHNCPQPDILVVCNDSVHGELLAYPTVVGEIFSSNRSNDMKKLARYKKCPSIFEILMIEQNKMQITLHKKSKMGQWSYETYHAGERIYLDSIEFDCLVDEIYHSVKFAK